MHKHVSPTGNNIYNIIRTVLKGNGECSDVEKHHFLGERHVLAHPREAGRKIGRGGRFHLTRSFPTTGSAT